MLSRLTQEDMCVCAVPGCDSNEVLMTDILCGAFNWASDVAVNRSHKLWLSYGVRHQTDRHKLRASLCPSHCLYSDLSAAKSSVYIFWLETHEAVPHTNMSQSSALHVLCRSSPLGPIQNTITVIAYSASSVLQHSRVCTSCLCLWMEQCFLCVYGVMLHLHHVCYELSDGRQQCGFHKPVCHDEQTLMLGCKVVNKDSFSTFTKEITEWYEKCVCCCCCFDTW